jgi:hypothetical protein
MDLGVTVNLYVPNEKPKLTCDDSYLPDVLDMRKRALVRFASPSMFRVPMKDVLIVFTALNW